MPVIDPATLTREQLEAELLAAWLHIAQLEEALKRSNSGYSRSKLVPGKIRERISPGTLSPTDLGPPRKPKV